MVDRVGGVRNRGADRSAHRTREGPSIAEVTVHVSAGRAEVLIGESRLLGIIAGFVRSGARPRRERRTSMTPWASSIGAITLFVRDVAASREFYGRVFGLPVTYEDDDSVVFRIGGTLINLLLERAAPELVAPLAVAPAGAGARFQFTIDVESVDATCALLAGVGVQPLNGPIDRPWGIRTASFADPDGYIWEVAQPA
jgi:catechol 2,3-dioxygenase-like lactoylglutathione lyase family enzyme